MKAKVAVAVAVSIMLCFASASFALTEVAGSEKRLIDQAQTEIEPALLSYTHFGVEYSVSVWMNFDPNITQTINSTLRYTAWTSSGLSSTGTIPAVPGYERYGDPILVKHPNATRIFLVGLALHHVLQNGNPCLTPDSTDSAIVVWYSDNGGWNWSNGTVIASERTTRDTTDAFAQFLDKPVITTSPNGTVWATYTYRNGNTSTVRVQSGTISGSTWTWSAPVTVPSSTGATAPMILVDSDDDVYVIATVGNGISFWRNDAQDSPDAGYVLQTNNGAVPNVGAILNGNLTVGTTVIRAVTVPVARIDRVRRRIHLVWHEANPAGGTRLQYAVYRIDAVDPNVRWTNTTFAAGTDIHHVNVGMDLDTTNGNAVVTWYRFDWNSSVYMNVGKYVQFDANHNPYWFSDDQVTGRLGDAADLTPDACNGLRHFGEYHDVSYTNGKFKSVHIIAVQPWSDPWVFTVQP